MIKVGIIGAGRIGRVHSESITKYVKGAEIKAISDVRVTDELKQWAKGMGIAHVYEDYKQILQDPEIDKYMAVVNDDVYLLFDSGHIYYSEGSQKAMLDVLEKYIDRICHVHLKDVRDEVVAEVKANDLSFLEGVRKGTFTVPGDGVIDFRPIFDILEKHNYKGWMVVEAEQDPAIANPFEYAVKGRKYIKETAGI